MSQELTTKNEALEMLKNSYEVETRPQKISLPRLSFVSVDRMEGEGKAKKVVTEAGTFIIERKTDELDENGKNIWSKEELGKEIEGTIIYQRKQLSHYDNDNGYTSSPIYDTNEEVVPLFNSGTEVHRGTATELKALPEYQGLTAKGKPTSKLAENKVLYVMIDGEAFQLNIKGSSLYSFQAYARTGVVIPAVVTRFTSEKKVNGSIEWNQMIFTAVKDLPEKKVMEIANEVVKIRETIELEKAQYQSDEEDEL